MTLGEKISSGRRKKGYSQQALAAECGISKRTVASYETDGRKPHPGTLKKLAAALDYSVDYLSDDTLDETRLPDEEQIYISGLRQTYGSETAEEIESLIRRSAAYFAGGKLSQEAKDKYFLALTNAYISCKKAGEDER